jgi:DMSO/TMAO reductase YedYZ molybdopterin-dependent catalytic subunit
MELPPGQRRVDGFPRFGTALQHPPPAVPPGHAIEVRGAGVEPFTVALEALDALERRAVTADFHCVAGWSATGLRWEGATFASFMHEHVEPALPDGVEVTHVVTKGLDGHRAQAAVADLLAGDALLADRLDGAPLDGDHGAPARLVSPSQYGYVSTKHLRLVELHTSPPEHVQSSLAMHILRPHPRARVWQEERHQDIPGRLLRAPYRLLIAPFRTLSAYGARRSPRAPRPPSDRGQSR